MPHIATRHRGAARRAFAAPGSRCDCALRPRRGATKRYSSYRRVAYAVYLRRSDPPADRSHASAVDVEWTDGATARGAC